MEEGNSYCRLFAGVSGYDYIGRRLGYRFVVRDAEKKSGRLKITVENCGFASLCEEADCCLVTEEDGRETDCMRIPTDARHWRSGQKVSLYVSLPQRKNQGGCLRVFLCLKRSSDGRSIRFANAGAGTRILLGEIKECPEI